MRHQPAAQPLLGGDRPYPITDKFTAQRRPQVHHRTPSGLRVRPAFQTAIDPRGSELQAKFVFSPKRCENIRQDPFLGLGPLVAIARAANLLPCTNHAPTRGTSL